VGGVVARPAPVLALAAGAGAGRWCWPLVRRTGPLLAARYQCALPPRSRVGRAVAWRYVALVATIHPRDQKTECKGKTPPLPIRAAWFRIFDTKSRGQPLVEGNMGLVCWCSLAT